MSSFQHKSIKLFLIGLLFNFLSCQFAVATTMDDLFVSLPPQGKIQATFHPEPSVITGKTTHVSFGLPFPKNTLLNAKQLKLIVNDLEVPISTKVTTRWHNFDETSPKFIRSLLVETDIFFLVHKPLNFSIEYGSDSTKSIETPKTNPRSSWVTISKNTNPDEYPANEYINEPQVYVTFKPSWLSACLLKTRTLAMNEVRQWSPFDNSVLNYGRTAVNDVSQFVKETEKINYITQPSPWLFDRASTLYSVYIRTGDIKWLRHAHRAAQFYANHINDRGYFDLKQYPDLKYSYGQSLLIDLILMGDLDKIAVIERIASAGSEWPETYSLSQNFWTERHLSYALLAALSAWETTGKKQYANRVNKLIRSTFDMAQNPFNGRRKSIGCLLHTMKQHEGADSLDPYCSPWMSALLSDAMWKYYLLSEDKKALEFIANLANYVVNHALYKGPKPHLHRFVIPWYLASNLKQFTDSGPWADLEHSCDVAGLVARGSWAAKFLGRETQLLVDSTNDLFRTCMNKTLRIWHRTSEITTGKPNWRLAPARKFNWWFGTNSDASWFMKTFDQ